MPTNPYDLVHAVRTDQGALRTAVQTWVRASDGRTITLVGTVHVADSGYYDTLTAMVADFAADGAQVHFEGVAKPDDATLAALTDLERSAVAALHRVLALGDRLAQAGGLTSQGDRLVKSETWSNVDASMVELIRQLGPHAVVDTVEDEGFQGFERVLPVAVGRPFVGTVVRFALRSLGHLARFGLAVKAARVGPFDSRVVVGWRDTIAAGAALAASAGSNVVLIWGVGHLPGIGRILASNDFTPDHRCWVTAIEPRHHVRDTLARILRHLRRAGQ